MSAYSRATPLALAVLLLLPAAAPSSVQPPPTVDGVETLASVNGETITLDDLFRQLEAMHAGVEAPGAMIQKPDPQALLERLINVRLVLQEAQNIGLHELPEMTRQFEGARMELLKNAVLEERLRDVTSGDPEETERLYREAVREVQVESVLFPPGDAAASFLAAIESGTEFSGAAASFLEEGRALAHQPPEYLDVSKLQPTVAEAIAALDPGGVSSPIPLPAGVSVLKLLDVRYPDVPAARADAERRALERRQQVELMEYGRELRERYAEVDEDLLDSLDFEGSDRDLSALRADDRVVAKIRGGEPITISQLVVQMEKKMFHGLERAAEAERAADEAPGALDQLIQRRAIVLEAERLGVEKQPAFQAKLREREDGLLFSRFLSKVIDPGVKLSTEELQSYHAEHIADYSSPAMMRLETLVFLRRDDAQAALRKLRQGADLKWIRTNSRGQVEPRDVDPEWRFDGQLLPVPEFPDEVRDAVAGAANGEYRFCEHPGGGPFHVLWIVQAFPSQPQKYDDVKSQIAVQVFSQKRQELLDEWMERLREASEVQVFVDEGQIRALLGLGSVEGA